MPQCHAASRPRLLRLMASIANKKTTAVALSWLYARLVRGSLPIVSASSYVRMFVRSSSYALSTSDVRRRSQKTACCPLPWFLSLSEALQLRSNRRPFRIVPGVLPCGRLGAAQSSAARRGRRREMSFATVGSKEPPPGRRTAPPHTSTAPH